MHRSQAWGMHASDPPGRSGLAASKLRRSLLMTPGNRLDRMLKAPAYGADCLVLDLEDSVPASQKPQARRMASQALESLYGGSPELCVRINSLGSGFGDDDLAGLPLELVDSLMIPKVESAQDLLALDAILCRMEAGRGRSQPLDLIVSLETPRGVLQALSIADASPRTSALFFGSGDYTAAIGAAVTSASLLHPRSVVAAAAGAARLQAIDAAYFLDVRDPSATREDARGARELGFTGKVVFHPVQVPVANETFSPTADEIARAARLVEAYRAATARGHGTALVDGDFVAIDLVAPAERLLQRAAQVRERQQP
jgi:citrate lyase beta subunit